MAAAILPLIGTAVSAIGTIAVGAAAKSQAQAQAQMDQFRAKQAGIAAGEARASAQRKAMETRREGTLAQSKRQAIAAASGGGATDPTEIKLGESLAARKSYLSALDMHEGESRARGMEDQAALARMQAAAALARGEAQQTGSYFTAGGSFLSGLGSAFGKFSDPAQAGPVRLGVKG